MTETVKYRDLFPRKNYIILKYTQEELDEAIAAEREACAKVCEEWVQIHGIEDVAAAIRTRKA